MSPRRAMSKLVVALLGLVALCMTAAVVVAAMNGIDGYALGGYMASMGGIFGYGLGKWRKK